MLKDPVESIHQHAAELRAAGKAFVLATVIEVQGSASAMTGSKAIFSPEGLNLLGWVGGGCAERFIGEQCAEATVEHKTRIVTADLDDELFGLGVACGGKMQVFIEPVPAAETVKVAVSPALKNEVQNLARAYGWNLVLDHKARAPQNFAEMFLSLAEGIAQTRNTSLLSLRERQGLTTQYAPVRLPVPKRVCIVGRSRITEALARHLALLSLDVRVEGPAVNTADYPGSVKCNCLNEGYDAVEFSADEVVIIASHTAQDPKLVERALTAKAAFVAMVGSHKRVLEVFSHLGWTGLSTVDRPLFVPAGLDIRARNPEEIALSIVAEILSLLPVAAAKSRPATRSETVS